MERLGIRSPSATRADSLRSSAMGKESRLTPTPLRMVWPMAVDVLRAPLESPEHEHVEGALEELQAPVIGIL